MIPDDSYSNSNYPCSDGNERVDDANVQSRDTGPGGHEGEQVAARGVKGDWTSRNDDPGNRVGYDGERMARRAACTAT